VPSKPEYRLFRLEFETPVRFGGGQGAAGLDYAEMTASSDSVFAAVCIEWLNLNGLESMRQLVEAVRQDNLLFSSLLPWQLPVSKAAQPEYYLPRPLLSGRIAAGSRNSQLKKQLKQLPCIAATAMDRYLTFVRTGEGDPLSFQASFATEVTWDRVNTRAGDDPLPYRVSSWQFNRGQKPDPKRKPSDRLAEQTRMTSGLYWLVCATESQLLENLQTVLESLGVTGIGGKTSSGLGKFIVWDDQLEDSPSGKALLAMLENRTSGSQMLLGTVSPDPEQDLTVLRSQDSRYLLVSRDGFTASAAFCDPDSGSPLKRKRCVLIREGSCFPARLEGSVLDLSYGGLHPVYRSGKALHVGLNI